MLNFSKQIVGMAETRYLISVGINDYELNPLNYCVKDLRDLNECMQKFCKVDLLNTFSVISDFDQPNYSTPQISTSRLCFDV